MPTVTGIATTFIDFTRASNATVTDSDGKVKWAPANLLTNSESFDAAAWQANSMSAFGSGSVANATAAPNGTTTADLRVPANASSTHTIWQPAVTSVNGVSYTTVLFVKPSGYTKLAIVENELTGYYVSYDATGSGTVLDQSSATGTITPLSDGWYQITHVSLAGGTSYRPQIFFLPASYTTGTYTSSWTPNGTSGMYLWGAALYRSDLAMQPNTSAYPLYNPTTPKNLLGYTQDFSNAAWTKGSLVTTGMANVTATTDPLGLYTADKLQEAAETLEHYIFQSITASAAPYTFSVYLKAAERTWATLQFTTGAISATWFNLASDGTGVPGTVAAGCTAASIYVGNGWYRCSVTRTATAATWYAVANPSLGNGISPVYAGTLNSGIYLWGAQLSDSASLDPYVPVYGAAVTSAAYYGPRRDFDPVTLACKGLLVEEQRVNLALRSAEFDNAASWVLARATVAGTANVAIAPDGTLTADKLVEDTTAANNHRIRQDVTTTAIAYTYSVHCKAAERGYVALYNLTTASGQVFNLLTGAVGVSTGTAPTSATITAVGDGWYRCDITVTATAATNSWGIHIMESNSSTLIYNGDGTSGIYIWGAQLEAGSFATSYIPVGATSAGATRNADVASVSTQAFPYSATEGTLVANGSWNGSASAGALFAVISDGGNSNRMLLYANNSAADAQFTVFNGGTPQADIGGLGATSAGQTFKAAAAYKANDFAAVGKSGSVSTDPSGTIPSVNILHLGSNLGTSNVLNGHIRQITYLPRRISNAELVTRST